MRLEERCQSRGDATEHGINWVVRRLVELSKVVGLELKPITSGRQKGT